jgi:hypothetical protein
MTSTLLPDAGVPGFIQECFAEHGITMSTEEILRHMDDPENYHPTGEQISAASRKLWKDGHEVGIGFTVAYLQAFFSPDSITQIRERVLDLEYKKATFFEMLARSLRC